MTEESAFVKALAAAQAEMDNAAFDKINPHFKSKYASLAAVRNACQAILNRHGFAVISTTEFIDGELWQKTELAHVSKESRFSYWPISPGTTQQRGSDNTYGRRYGLSGFASISSEEDDDGNISALAKPKSAYQTRKDGDYPQLAHEIDCLDTTADLRAWGIQNQHRISVMPEQWKEHLRIHFSRRLKELGGTEGPPSTLREDLKKSLAIELSKEEAEELEGAGVDLTTEDPKAFLDDLDATMAGAADEVTVMEVWSEYSGIKDILPPEAQKQAEMILEKNMRRAKADAAARYAQKMREGKK